MKMSDIPFHTTDWTSVEPTAHAGETGMGHILLCLEGELHTELADGRTFVLTPGTSSHVADGAEAHRSSTKTGAKVFIVD